MVSYERFYSPRVLARIGRLELRAKMVVEGIVSGMHKSPYHGQSVEFVDHRQYVAGDDLRHLDWKVFGRADRLVLKRYEEETNLRAHLFLGPVLGAQAAEAQLLDCRPFIAEHPQRSPMLRMRQWRSWRPSVGFTR